MPDTVVKFDCKVGGKDLKPEESRLVTFLYYDTIRDCAQYYIELVDQSWSYFDQVYESEAEIQLRFGLQLGGQTTWSTMKKLLVGDVEANYHPQSVRVTIAGLDKGVKLFNTCSQKVWKKKKISDMVKDLAQASGLNTQIEDTKDDFDITQGIVPDGHFIRKYLLPRAYNASRQDYLFYIKDGSTVVFEPPDVGSEQMTLKFPGDEAQYGPLEPLRCYYRPLMLAPNGSWSTQVRSVNPLKKEADFFTADDGTVSLKKLASKMPTAPDKPARIRYVTDFTKDVTENLGKALWCRRCRELWIVDTKTFLSPKLEVGKPVRLQVTGGNGQSHFTSGKYLVAGALHWIDTQAADSFTRLWLARRSR